MTKIVKLAQPGFDVKTSGDENLIYNSKWPLLPIYKAGGVLIDRVESTQVLAEHDLPFIPMFWYFANTTIGSWENLTIARDTRAEFFGPIGDGTLSMTDKKLTLTASAFPFASGPAQIYYYIFAIDLDKEFKAPIINVGAIQGGGGSREFKIAKPGKSVESNNLDDYILHSRARSPLVHSVTPGKVTGGEFIVTHNLGYSPMFFAYTKSNGAYSLLSSGSGGSTILSSDKEKVRFQENTDGRQISIVILKDPFEVTYTRTAVVP